MGACADISLIPSVDMGLVLISTKIVRWKSGAAGTLISRAMQRSFDLVRRVRIQLHYDIPRTPWLPPFVLCVRQLYVSRSDGCKFDR